MHFQSLDEKDIALLKSYGQGQYTKSLKVILSLTYLGIFKLFCNFKPFGLKCFGNIRRNVNFYYEIIFNHNLFVYFGLLR